MKVSSSGSALCAVAIVACSPPAIPPPVLGPPPSATADPLGAKPNPANADPNLKPPFGPYDVQSAFHIEKSNDKDHIDYGIRLDSHCVPISDRAMFPYWRELDHPPPVRSHPLSFMQNVAYGFSEQRVLERGASGGKYQVRLKQVDRPILVVTAQDADSHCTATSYTKIEGVKDARIDYIFVKVAGPMSVDYVDVHGTDVGTGKPLAERLTR